KNDAMLHDDVDTVLSREQIKTTEATAANSEEPAAKEEAVSKQAVPSGEAYPETREKMSGIRRAIASAMVNSTTKAPHVTLLDEVDVTELLQHRKRFKEVAQEQDVKLTYLPYV